MSARIPPGKPGPEDPYRAVRRRDGHVERIQRPRMADLGVRPVGPHRAVAEAEVALSQEALSAVIDGTAPKGDVLAVAELAGVMAGKRASELIPLAHPVALSDLLVRATPERATSAIRIRAEAAAISAAGVEMEALTAAAVASLTVCDMVSGLDRAIGVRSLRLVSISSEEEEWRRPDEPRPEAHVPPGARSAGRVTPSPGPLGPHPGRRRSP